MLLGFVAYAVPVVSRAAGSTGRDWACLAALVAAMWAFGRWADSPRSGP